MVIRNDPVTVKHTKWIFTDVGKVIMSFVLATDFDFIAYMNKMAFFWKLFSRQWRFWNMISMIFVVLYDILHYCNLPYERSETESSRFENNVTSSHTSECWLTVRSATRRVDLEICFSQLYPNGKKYAVLGINCYKMFLILPRTTVLRRSKCCTWKTDVQQRAHWLVVCYS